MGMRRTSGEENCFTKYGHFLRGGAQPSIKCCLRAFQSASVTNQKK